MMAVDHIPVVLVAAAVTAAAAAAVHIGKRKVAEQAEVAM